jgi:hypothetical protein
MNTIHLRILAIDEGRQLLSLIDTGANEFIWTLDLAAWPLARDLQRLDAERVLVGFDRGFFELEWETGRVLSVCERWTDVTAVTRLADGSTLVTGTNLDGGGGVTVLTLDPALNVVATARREGDYVRLMRRTDAGTYLLCTNDHILETTPALQALGEFRAPGFEHAWKAVRREDGSTWVSAGYGAFMAVFGANGELQRTFGAAGQVPASVAPFFYASFEFLPNGHVLVANWQGHGPDNGHKGEQLLQFDAEGQLVATWSAGARISSLQGLLVL